MTTFVYEEGPDHLHKMKAPRSVQLPHLEMCTKTCIDNNQKECLPKISKVKIKVPPFAKAVVERVGVVTL